MARWTWTWTLLPWRRRVVVCVRGPNDDCRLNASSRPGDRSNPTTYNTSNSPSSANGLDRLHPPSHLITTCMGVRGCKWKCVYVMCECACMGHVHANWFTFCMCTQSGSPYNVMHSCSLINCNWLLLYGIRVCCGMNTWGLMVMLELQTMCECIPCLTFFHSEKWVWAVLYQLCEWEAL